MTAPFQRVKTTEKALATRAVPHIGARPVTTRLECINTPHKMWVVGCPALWRPALMIFVYPILRGDSRL